VRLAPVLSLCVAACAAIEQVIFSMLPVYGLGHGVMAREMSAVQTVLITGSIVLQMPLGLAAERFGARRALVGCILGAGIGALAFPLFIDTPAIWPFVFVWGALAFGIYTLALAELGQRFSGAMLVAGNAAFALMWGLGGIVGPPAAGGAMDAIGVEGMPLTVAAICLALAAIRIAKR
jgi:MFS family permease